ncbi:MAG: MaoC family dehydratase [Desulfatibacillum sp.]|nr:MaoC family dehydratase [Desulfatibacillum sp.]
MENERKIYRFRTHRRTITETDIVNFVNLVGLHEPPFIDMEYVKEFLPGSHQTRFAPAPLLISIGMGLAAPIIMQVVETISKEENLGAFHGMVGVEAFVKNPAFPGDTLRADLEACVDRVTSRGQILVDVKHMVTNQRDELVVVFTEKVLFEPPAPKN